MSDNIESTGWFLKLINKVKDYLNRVPEEPKEEDYSYTALERWKRLSQIMGRLANLDFALSAITIKQFFLIELKEVGDLFEGSGVEDGKLEINPHLIVDFISYNAKQLQSYISGVFKGKKNAAQTTQLARETTLKAVEKDLENQKKYTEAIEKKYRFDYKDFALFIGILYIIFSLGFLIADFPLSRLIVVQGFEIEAIESWLLTIGITLIGVYFKIWWDEFINPAVEKFITKNDPINLEGFETLSEEDKNNNKTNILVIKRHRTARVILKTSILLLALGTIGILGYFRYIVYLDTTFTLANNPIPPALQSFWAIAGFIFISLLFPFLGGICLSIGTDKIQNWKERRKAKRELKEKEREFSRALQAKEEAKKELDVSTEYLNWCTSTQFTEDCINLFTSRYNRGYEIGLTKHNLEMDLLAKAENVRKRMLAKNTFINTQPIISRDYFTEE